MATYKELQEMNRQRQTGRVEFDLPRPAYNPENIEGIALEEDTAPDAPIITGRDLIGAPGAGNDNYVRQAIESGWGDSRYDMRSGFQPGEDLEDLRAREQSNMNKLLRGVAKGAVTFGTTLANTYAGILIGGLRMSPMGTLYASMAGKLREGDASAYLGANNALNQAVNNPVSSALVGLQNTMEEILPNYRTEQEQSEEYQRGWMNPTHWNANFWADFIKNFGFTAGAMVGGAGWSKILGKGATARASADLMKGVEVAAAGDAEALNALKGAAYEVQRGAVAANSGVLRNNIRNQAKKLMSLPIEQQFAGALISAFGEGSAEGLMARQEFLDDFMPAEQQRFRERYDALEGEIMENPDYYDEVLFEGEEEPRKIMNAAGQEALLKAQNDLFELYRQRSQYANEQADNLASITFLMNIPILTASNAIQFARMFGGGWDTARRTAANVTGKMGQYGAGAPVWLRSVGNVAKVMGTEGSEEMLQGFVSSGAKRVADDKLTYFNDLTFDKEAVGSMKDWLASMAEGGAEYLGDVKNWQEGFMGALTGILGVPGRGYFRGQRGGIFGAVAEARDQFDANQKAADELNNVVNSPEFQNRWKGYIRHLKLTEDMRAAVANDDEYSYHNASDNMLASDIMMFAKAGKIDDLADFANRYASLSDDDVQQIREQLGDPQDMNGTSTLRNEDIKESVEKQAKNVKETIKEYAQVYNDMKTILPTNTPEDMFDEVVLTTMQLNSIERRFLSMLKETVNDVGKLMASRSDNATDRSELIEKFDKMAADYTKVFSGSLVPVSEAKQKETKETLDKLKAFVRNDNALRQKVADMEKAYTARQKYYEKIDNLKDMTPEEFNAQAETQEKVQDRAAKEQLKQQAETLQETYGNLDTVEKMQQAYRAEQDKDGFVELMRGKANNGEEGAKKFVGLYDTYNRFREALAVKHPEIVNKNTGSFSNVAELMLDQLFVRAQSESDFVKNLDTFAFDMDDISQALNVMVQSKALTEDEAMPMLVQGQFKAAQDAINDIAADFRESWTNTSGRESLTNAPKQEAKEPIDDDAAPEASAKPVVNVMPESPVESEKEETPASEESEKNEEDSEEPFENPETSEAVADQASSYRDESMPEQQALRQDEKGAVKYGYYQQTIPEIPTSVAKEVRALIMARKNASREEMRAIDDALSKYKIADFVEFNEKGEPVTEATKGYADVYKWLSDNHAFEYTSKDLNPNDDVVFAIMEGAPEYKGNKQIVVAVVKNRNENGEITELQPLTMLHSPEHAGDYMNLDELYDAIYADYESREPSGTMYVFGGLSTPKTSKVWGKRPGLMRYTHDGSMNRIDQIPSYDENAPIMVMDENNHPVVLRGNIDASKIHMPNIYEWSANHYGRLYYLVKSGDAGYAPVFIDKVGIKPEMIENPSGNNLLGSIQNSVNNIDKITAELTSENVEDSNLKLRGELKKLNELVNLDGITLDYIGGAEPRLGITLSESRAHGGANTKSILPGESIEKLFADYSITPRLSPKEKWNASSKRNLADAIDAGLLVSNVQELRQVGVNFMFDPWDAASGEFRRILPSASGDNSKQPIPKNDKQIVAKDAEVGGADYVASNAQAPANIDYGFISGPQGAHVSDNLDELFSGETAVFPEDNLNLDFESLPDSVAEMLEKKGVSKKTWDEADENLRNHLLNC